MSDERNMTTRKTIEDPELMVSIQAYQRARKREDTWRKRLEGAQRDLQLKGRSVSQRMKSLNINSVCYDGVIYHVGGSIWGNDLLAMPAEFTVLV